MRKIKYLLIVLILVGVLLSGCHPVIKVNVDNPYIPNSGFDGISNYDDKVGKYIYLGGEQGVIKTVLDDFNLDSLKENPMFSHLYDFLLNEETLLGWYPGDMYGVDKFFMYEIYEDGSENVSLGSVELDFGYESRPEASDVYTLSGSKALKFDPQGQDQFMFTIVDLDSNYPINENVVLSLYGLNKLDESGEAFAYMYAVSDTQYLANVLGNLISNFDNFDQEEHSCYVELEKVQTEWIRSNCTVEKKGATQPTKALIVVGVKGNPQGQVYFDSLYLGPDKDGDGYSTSIMYDGQEVLGNLEEDCNDSNADAYPGAPANCMDNVDNNCNGIVDETGDLDGDGYKSKNCEVGQGKEVDCSDASFYINPGATELCNGIDDNCNALVDEDLDDYLVDADNDGYKDVTVAGQAYCSEYYEAAGLRDCNDGDANVHPNNEESCDSIDNNCNGIIDETLPDADHDGVCNLRDECENTPIGVPVYKEGENAGCAFNIAVAWGLGENASVVTTPGLCYSEDSCILVQPYGWVEQEIPEDNLEKDAYYTLSGFIKGNQGQVLLVNGDYPDDFEPVYGSMMTSSEEKSGWVRYNKTFMLEDVENVKLILTINSSFADAENIYFDNVQLEKSDAVTEFNPTDLRQECCPSDYCWSGEECIAESLFYNASSKPIDYSPESNKGFRCVDGGWYLSDVKLNWDGCSGDLDSCIQGGNAGFCPDNDMCLVSSLNSETNYSMNGDLLIGQNDKTPQCINSNSFVGDHLCAEGKWSSRTRLVATALLGHAEKSGEDFTLYCDRFIDVLNDFEYGTLPSLICGNSQGQSSDDNVFSETGCVNMLEASHCDYTVSSDFESCIDKVCVLRFDSGETIAGLAVNVPFNDSEYGFHRFLDNVDNVDCDGVEGLEACNDESTLWYDKDMGLVFLGNKTFDLKNDQSSTLDKAVDWIVSILEFVGGAEVGDILKDKYDYYLDIMTEEGKSSVSPYISTLNYQDNSTLLGDFNRLYVAQNGDKKVIAKLDKVFDIDLFHAAYYLVAGYDGFVLNDLCDSVNAFSAASNVNDKYLCEQLDGGSVVMKSTVLGQDFETPDLYQLWTDLTAKLRFEDFKKVDTDGDGCDDYEDDFMYDPAACLDTDHDGYPDGFVNDSDVGSNLIKDPDKDNDGLNNTYELSYFEVVPKIKYLIGEFEYVDKNSPSNPYKFIKDYNQALEILQNANDFDCKLLHDLIHIDNEVWFIGVQNPDEATETYYEILDEFLDGFILCDLKGLNESNPDTDGDGLNDGEEVDLDYMYNFTTEAWNNDTDGDGLLDGCEINYNNQEEKYKKQGKCILPGIWDSKKYNPYNFDFNPSGKDLNVTNPDTDGDGLTDGDEVLEKLTNPLKADTDGDGLSDGCEVNPGPCGFLTQFTSPDPLLVDTDEDGLDDLGELGNKTDPNSADTDNDGLSDYIEVVLYKTNPLHPDTDGDTLSDGIEDSNQNGVKDEGETSALLEDTDGDMLRDDEEMLYGTDPNRKNNDGFATGTPVSDGYSDWFEIYVSKTNPLNVDTDGDNKPDGYDNCPFNKNSDQADMNGNGVGDVCDSNGEPGIQCAPVPVVDLDNALCEGLNPDDPGVISKFAGWKTIYGLDEDIGLGYDATFVSSGLSDVEHVWCCNSSEEIDVQGPADGADFGELVMRFNNLTSAKVQSPNYEAEPYEHRLRVGLSSNQKKLVCEAMGVDELCEISLKTKGYNEVFGKTVMAYLTDETDAKLTLKEEGAKIKICCHIESNV
jgi:hypothetical protein